MSSTEVLAEVAQVLVGYLEGVDSDSKDRNHTGVQ
ncbi:hypothetical protein G9444_3602 [Rhodococcus erythropolis]|uniref:Uncharacterized protein n=3 Tax=Bacillati TaxID=1783272 RepID=A0A6G9CVW4_RHOER|nr:hypothetical protein G9444_3602 [Rhodococcus erythropolis]